MHHRAGVRREASRLLHMAVDGDIEVAVSEPVISEVLRVLREKFGWQGYDIQAARQRIERTARMVRPEATLDVIAHDPPDNRVLECCDAAGSEYIVTEDRDLFRLKRHGNASIVKAADFLAVKGERAAGRDDAKPIDHTTRQSFLLQLARQPVHDASWQWLCQVYKCPISPPPLPQSHSQSRTRWMAQSSGRSYRRNWA